MKKIIIFLNIIINALKAFIITFTLEVKGFICDYFTNKSIKNKIENIKFSVFKRSSPGSIFYVQDNYYIHLNPEYYNKENIEKILIISHELGHYLTKDFSIGIRTLYLESYADIIGVILTSLELKIPIKELSNKMNKILFSFGNTEEHLKRADNISYFSFLLEKEKVSIENIIDLNTLKINVEKLHSTLLIKE